MSGGTKVKRRIEITGIVTIAILYQDGGFRGITDDDPSFRFGVNQNSIPVGFCTS